VKGKKMQEILQEMPDGALALTEIGALGALFEPSTSSETKLVGAEERLIRELVLVLEKQLLAGLSCSSVSEFVVVRTRVFPRYVRALRALSDTVGNLASEDDVAIRAAEASAQIASDLEKQRGTRFVDALVEQAVFALWTTGKMRSLGRQLNAFRGPCNRKADADLAEDFRVMSLWAQFHLDSVIAAVKFDQSIPSEIQHELCKGMRAMVNAYAIMKEAMALRVPRPDALPVAALPWDEEDERLLASSMRDINGISSASDR
jgi:hypothetical protein